MGARMRLRWLRQALRNLEDEANFTAADDPVAARLVVKRVLDAVAMLPAQPGLGRPGRVAGTRELVVLKTRYLVPYRVRGEVIEVLRVFHTSRRLPDRW
jgi:toxin ParE1/3/4